MASAIQIFPKMLKALRENGNTEEKREALTYIRSNAKKMEVVGLVKEDHYKELSKAIIEAYVNGDHDIQHKAYDTLKVIIQDFKSHTLNIFESLLHANRKHRLKILKLLEAVDDNAIMSAANDTHAVTFFNDCLLTVEPIVMGWITPTACVDNLQLLTEAENRNLFEDDKVEEELLNSAIILLTRLYRLAEITSDQRIQRFDTLLMDKIVTLAYMGHKRQRGSALQLLQQSVQTNLATNIRTNFPDLWTQYKQALQSTYCKRMLLLVAACEPEWANQWNISIQFLGTELHRGAGLINNLLSVEEKAFKSGDTIIRRQAFLSWKLLIDNFALDVQELTTIRRIKLLCIPLNARNTRNELISLTKLEAWWHLIIKLDKDIVKFIDLVLKPFFNFCFGPLGDTPLLSSKFDIVASPGKQFFKTKIVAVDALCQLLVTNQENHNVFTPILEERLPHRISNIVFQECHKSIIHSVGEALLILSQLNDTEMKNRYQLGRILWRSLASYAQSSNTEIKTLVYKNILCVITELLNHATEKPMIKDLVLSDILLEFTSMINDINYCDLILLQLILKLLTRNIFSDMKKEHTEAVKFLFGQYIKTKGIAHQSPHTLDVLVSILDKLVVMGMKDQNITAMMDLWCMLAETLIMYMQGSQEINEENATKHKFDSVEKILLFPFAHISPNDCKEVQYTATVWKNLFKQFCFCANLIATVTSNEILSNTSKNIIFYIKKDSKYCSLAAYCLDALMNVIDYDVLIVQNEVSPIADLIVELIVIALENEFIVECKLALKALSAILITMYEHNAQKVVIYLGSFKPAIELMLSSDAQMLIKEVRSTWETIVGIFKGLALLTYDLLLLYKDVILQALIHPNADISCHAIAILEIEDNVDNKAEQLLTELRRQIRRDNLSSTISIVKKKSGGDDVSPTRKMTMLSSFLNKNLGTRKSIPSPQVKKDTNTIPLVNIESVEYVSIKTDIKFDANKFTEHQKECLKQRREDISAMYNDLAHSSAQGTEDLQEWFQSKANQINESEKVSITSNVTNKENIDYDANKENKIAVESMTTDKSNRLSEKELTHVQNDCEQSTSVTPMNNATLSVQNNDDTAAMGDKSKQTEDELQESSMTKSIRNLNANITTVIEQLYHTDEKSHSFERTDLPQSAAEKLDFECREELLDNKADPNQLSSSVLDISNRRTRIKIAKTPSASKTEQCTQDETSITRNYLRTLRTKVHQDKVITIIKEKCLDTSGDKEKVSNESRKGIKRKAGSDSETESSVNQRQRRKTSAPDSQSDSDSVRSLENDTASVDIDGLTEDVPLSQRMKNEISRLKIDMVFDSALPSRRRSKAHEDYKDVAVSTGKRQHSPDSMGTRLRSADSKMGEQPKRIAKISEKDAKLNSNGQTSTVRRSKRSLKQETEKGDESGEPSKDKKSGENKKGKIDLQDTNAMDCLRIEFPTANSGMIKPTKKQNEVNEGNRSEATTEDKSIECDKVQTEYILLNKCNANSPPSISTTTQSGTQDIVENSQEVSLCPKLDKMYNEKQCFIKINKIEDVHIAKPCETIEIASSVRESSKYAENETPDLPSGMEFDSLKDNCIVQKDQSETYISDPTQSLQGTEIIASENEKNIVLDPQKIVDVSTFTRSVTPSLLSPKNNSKRYNMKLKHYSAQGRAAHMLGLVTNQALLEDSQTMKVDDEPGSKKLKSRDLDNETITPKKDKCCIMREADKLGGSSGSRQEKIFNNMRSPEYCSSPPLRLFSNLKNDGEKISTKVDKLVKDHATEALENIIGKGKESDLSPTDEKSELPILEWSSANPPSLTASPSASILKRNRPIFSETDSEAFTTNKRKRVSFADPPVSKEMGYETANIGSPNKNGKLLAARPLISRRDSPLRFKQSRMKLLQLDAEKMEKEILMDGTSEIDLQCERENEILTKIAEELEYSENITIDVDAQASRTLAYEKEMEDTVDTNNCNKVTVDNLSVELKITENTLTSRNVDLCSVDAKVVENRKHIVEPIELPFNDLKNITMADTHTQVDMFTDNTEKSVDAQIEIKQGEFTINNKERLSTADTAVNAFQCNVTNDSVMQGLCEESAVSEDLEETVDVHDMTELSSSVSCDEMFCTKLIRTSTQTTDAAEQDTLSVTESMFISLPLNHDSQNMNRISTEVLDPESLCSDQPIFPTLTSCKKSVSSLLKHLTNPLWVQSLETFLTDRSIRTIGDLAILSEREVNRLPVKGNPKHKFVRKVLQHFEHKHNQMELELVESADVTDVIVTSESMLPSVESSNVETSVIKDSIKYGTVLNSSATDITNGIENVSMQEPFAVSIVPTTISSEIVPVKTIYVATPVIPISYGDPCAASHQQQSLSINSTAKVLPQIAPGSFMEIKSTNTSTCPLNFGTITMDRSLGRPILPKISAADDPLGCTTVNTLQPCVIVKKSVGTCTDLISHSQLSPKKSSKSVGSQMALEDLLDEIDVNLVLQSAVRRCTPEKILSHYRMKMKSLSDQELEKETLRLLGLEGKTNHQESALKSVCRACGVNKVLLRLPDIFSADKQFFIKVLNAYRKKIKASDILNVLDFDEVKDAICQKCTSSEIAEMLSTTLKEEEKQKIRTPMTKLSSLNAMLKRMPMDVIISHTVANDELIPSQVVLDIALQNNSSDDIVRALDSQSPILKQRVFEKLCSPESLARHIEKNNESKDTLLQILSTISSKLDAQELLKAYYESMKAKIQEM